MILYPVHRAQLALPRSSQMLLWQLIKYASATRRWAIEAQDAAIAPIHIEICCR